jgi:hypothetical protein
LRLDQGTTKGTIANKELPPGRMRDFPEKSEKLLFP